MTPETKALAEQLELAPPPKPRRRSHRVADTSLAAKGNARSRSSTGIYALILEHVTAAMRDPQRLGATADEVHQASAKDQREATDLRRLMNIRRRVSDLVGKGQLRETALRRPNSEGNLTIVWAAVENANG